MGGFSLTKKAGDTFAICALVILSTSVFVMTNKYSVSSGSKIVNAYLRDEVIYQMAPKTNRTYVFYTEEHVNNFSDYNDYLIGKPLNITEVYDIANKKFVSLTNPKYVEVTSANAKLLLGPIVVNINNGYIDVLGERSQHNYCSIMKPTNQSNWPLTCAPNYFRVVIEVEK